MKVVEKTSVNGRFKRLPLLQAVTSVSASLSQTEMGTGSASATSTAWAGAKANVTALRSATGRATVAVKARCIRSARLME